MLTVKKLSARIGKTIHTIRYWITHDTIFLKMFWRKEIIKYTCGKGYTYFREMYVCDEADATKIVEYINTQKKYKKQIGKWSDIAIHCFERKMICNGCMFNRYCCQFEHPPIKDKVLEFVRLYGDPHENS